MRELNYHEDALVEGIAKSPSGQQIGLFEVLLHGGRRKADGFCGYTRFSCRMDDDNNWINPHYLVGLGERIATRLFREAGDKRVIYRSTLNLVDTGFRSQGLIFYPMEVVIRVNSWSY